jgi:hypothetical protein
MEMSSQPVPPIEVYEDAARWEIAGPDPARKRRQNRQRIHPGLIFCPARAAAGKTMPATRRRNPSSFVNRMTVPPGPETAAMLQKVHEAVSPPKDWDGKPYRPPLRTVSVTMPAGWVDMAEYLAPAQGMTCEHFLSILIGEQLYDVWRDARIQHRKSQKAKPDLPTVSGDLDDDIPF